LATAGRGEEFHMAGANQENAVCRVTLFENDGATRICDRLGNLLEMVLRAVRKIPKVQLGGGFTPRTSFSGLAAGQGRRDRLPLMEARHARFDPTGIGARELL